MGIGCSDVKNEERNGGYPKDLIKAPQKPLQRKESHLMRVLRRRSMSEVNIEQDFMKNQYDSSHLPHIG
jgi:hypothetical protein